MNAGTYVLSARSKVAHREALRAACRLVASADGQAAVLPWLLTPNCWLDDLNPLEALEVGWLHDVVDAARTRWRSGT